jgi:hypothetical protein
VRDKESKVYQLTKPDGVRPPTLSQGEGTVVYMCLEENGAKPKTWAELTKLAQYRKLPAFFKRHDSTTIEESLNYWLDKFHKNGWIQVADL